MQLTQLSPLEIGAYLGLIAALAFPALGLAWLAMN